MSDHPVGAKQQTGGAIATSSSSPATSGCSGRAEQGTMGRAVASAADSWAPGPAQGGLGRPAGCPGAKVEGLDAAAPNWTVGVVVGAAVEMASATDARYGQKESSDQNFDYMFKILIIGNSSVGKTSFLFRYADDSFTPAFVSTVGIDFKVKTIYRNEKRIKLQIWLNCRDFNPNPKISRNAEQWLLAVLKLKSLASYTAYLCVVHGSCVTMYCIQAQEPRPLPERYSTRNLAN
ncbi:UNVERIFIED_CONTAM: hypothetical protein FKN15_040162 [Acipenser sinensis]